VNQKLYSVEKASELSGLRIDTIKNFIELKADILAVVRMRRNLYVLKFFP